MLFGVCCEHLRISNHLHGDCQSDVRGLKVKREHHTIRIVLFATIPIENLFQLCNESLVIVRVNGSQLKETAN